MGFNFPKPPQKGEEILAWCRQITELIRSISPRAGAGMDMHRSSAGTTFSARQKRGVAEAKRHPFECYAAGEDTVRVVPGTVNTHIPVTIGAEEEEVVDWEFAIGEEECYIVLRAELAGDGSVEGAEISLMDEIPEQPEGNTETGSAPSASYRLVARITRNDSEKIVVENFLNGSQWVGCQVAQWNCDEQRIEARWTQ